ncbi:hypothetical protein M405DRAFT_25443 [Rhizopogon salebrosus TDB-379]|nr:hypothetical protein M405DRAFT_25443 [Rhizopogon salebrosus TDB-379]
MEGQCQSPPAPNIPPVMQLLHTNRVPTDVQKRDIINLIQVQEALRSDAELE